MRPLKPRRTGPLPSLEAVLALALTALATVTVVLNAVKLKGRAAEGAGVDRPAAGGTLHPRLYAVHDATELPNGDWALLDRSSREVHIVDSSGAPLDRFGGPGRGPGELPSVVALAALGDTVVVAGGLDGSLHFFFRDGTFIRVRESSAPDCLGSMVTDLQASGRDLLVLTRCLSPNSLTLRASVVRTGPEGPREVASRRLSVEGAGRTLNPLAFPVLAASDHGFVLGSLLDPCLEVFGKVGGLPGSLCHPADERVPFPAELHPLGLQRKAAERVGIGVVVPEYLPAFDRVFLSPVGLVFRTVTGADSRTLHLLRADGSLAELAAGLNDATFVGRSSILVAVVEMEGTRIRVLPLEVGE